MAFTLTMPKLSPTMEEGSIVKWHQSEGKLTEAGSLLIEVATDKATVEYSALDEGYLRKILVQEGKKARVGDPIAIFTESADEDISSYQPEGVSKGVQMTPTPEHSAPEPPKSPRTNSAPETSVAPGLAQPAFVPAPPIDHDISESSSIKPASPLAKKLAKEKGIDIENLKGSGPGGRVVSRDLPHALSKGIIQFHSQRKPTEKAGAYEEEPLTQMRKAIGSRLQASKTFIPHFYVSQKVDATNLVELRAQLKALGIKLTVNDFITKACAIALEHYPAINSGYNSENNTIIRFKTVGISVAVQIEAGLITPIIQHANFKRIDQIAQEVRALAAKAKEGKLKPEEFQGGSFTISNLGAYGVSQFGAILNPPQAAILAVAGIEDAAVIRDGKPVATKQMILTLSCDHRVIDGADAAEFLKGLKALLENPAGLIV
jgi:pyruvate dehydrogenase E2 component (dihydrolipoamide acetyltransferase)